MHLSKIFGHSEEFQASTTSERSTLTLYYLTSLISIAAGGWIWYTLFDTFEHTYTGLIAGLLYALVLYTAEKGMVQDVTAINLVVRAIMLVLLVVFSGMAMNVASEKSNIIYQIRKDSGGENLSFQKEMNKVDERYKSEGEAVLAKWLELAEKGKSNKEIEKVIGEMRKEKVNQKKITIENIKTINKVKEADFGFLSILSTYMKNQKSFNSNYYQYLILIELLPLIIFGFYKGRNHFGV